MKKSYKISFGGICVALSLVVLLLTGIFPFADYALPAIAGLFTAVALIELNPKWAFVIYLVTAILAPIIVPIKESAFLYLLFFGYYGIIKSKLEGLKSQALEWVLKLLIFNIAIVVSYYLMINVLGLNGLTDEFNEFGKYGIWGFWGVSNIVFIIYDIAYSRLVTYYCKVFRQRYLRKFK